MGTWAGRQEGLLGFLALGVWATALDWNLQGSMERTPTSAACVQVLPPSLTNLVILGKCLNLSEPQLPPLYDGDNPSTCPVELLGGKNSQCLEHAKNLINGNTSRSSSSSTSSS